MAAALCAQGPAITAATTITASVGALVCTATPGATSAGVSTMHGVCLLGGAPFATLDGAVPATPGTDMLLSVGTGTPRISIAFLLTRGNATPDAWQVSVSDGAVTKSKSGVF